jgi:hypothetical protein
MYRQASTDSACVYVVLYVQATVNTNLTVTKSSHEARSAAGATVEQLQVSSAKHRHIGGMQTYSMQRLRFTFNVDDKRRTITW